LDTNFRNLTVWLILNGETKKAIEILSKNYKISAPKLKVGLPKGRKVKALGCYSPKNSTISVRNSDVLRNPFVILHEFYHHMRTSIDKEHKGTEKNADKFAMEFIKVYESARVKIE
jgi:hypothetical protein